VALNLPHFEQEAEVKGKPRIATGRKWSHPGYQKSIGVQQIHVYSRALFRSTVSSEFLWFRHLVDVESTPRLLAW
jgi:hypothetical protein